MAYQNRSKGNVVEIEIFLGVMFREYRLNKSGLLRVVIELLIVPTGYSVVIRALYKKTRTLATGKRLCSVSLNNLLDPKGH